jgi:thiosulfate dehydrogenase [quinone] large subunit
MNHATKTALFLLRVGLGWVFVYAGFSKIIDPSWSAAGYLTHASTLSGFYNTLASSSNIGWVNFLNEWGLLLIGLSLVFGFLVRYSSIAAIALMALYWVAILKFPLVGPNAYLVDEHIIYILIFVLFISANAGNFWGIDGKWAKNY